MNRQQLLARFYDPVAAFGLREPELADRMFAQLGAPRRILHLLMRVASLPVQLADGFEDTADNLDGSYVRMLAAAGLRDVREEGHVRTPLGTVAVYCGSGRAQA